MIQLHHDYLLFQIPSGEVIPCSAEVVAVELVGESMSSLDPDLLRHAAAAVLHYFKQDLGRLQVTVEEFSTALERVLRGLGFTVKSVDADPLHSMELSDLQQLARASAGSFELDFFPRIRAELHTRLGRQPDLVTFSGLRNCVKQLLGVKRWSNRCQALNDRIVEYLRDCLSADERGASCGLVVR